MQEKGGYSPTLSLHCSSCSIAQDMYYCIFSST